MGHTPVVHLDDNGRKATVHIWCRDLDTALDVIFEASELKIESYRMTTWKGRGSKRGGRSRSASITFEMDSRRPRPPMSKAQWLEALSAQIELGESGSEYDDEEVGDAEQ